MSQSKYLPHFFDVDEDFVDSFLLFIKLIDDAIEQKGVKASNLELFNSLDNNLKTKQLFKKHKINYKKYTEFNPNSYIKIKVRENKNENKIIKNLENDFNDELYKIIPEEERNKISSKLEEEGYHLKEIDVPKYDNDGYFTNYTKKHKLLKNDEPINIKDDL